MYQGYVGDWSKRQAAASDKTTFTMLSNQNNYEISTTGKETITSVKNGSGVICFQS
jgi:hypothetical protein